METSVAFRAVIELLKEHGKDYLRVKWYEQCRQSLNEDVPVNHVKRLYEQVFLRRVSDKLTEIVKPADEGRT